MNRTLKFRVWFAEERRFLETKDGLFFKYPHNEMGEYIGDFIRDPYFVQQFTGLKDKDNREIYEGDILKVHGTSYDRGSRKDEPYGNVVVRHVCHDRSSGFNLFMTFKQPIEVIGNIFENPDLV